MSAVSSSERSLHGWGRTAPSTARVLRPASAVEVPEAVADAIATASDGLIPRGAGRSYGDAAQNAGGAVIDMTALDRILALDRAGLRLTAQAGVTIAQMMARLAVEGLTLPVVPGTSQVTLGGAIASDIHGKNHHQDGGFARHVSAITLLTPGGELLDLTPETNPDLFYATLGGLGLTGIVTEATLKVEPLSAPWVAEDSDRTSGLAETLEIMAMEESHRYSVAWLDLLAEGGKFGRAVVGRANPLPASEMPVNSGILHASRSRFPGVLVNGPTVEVPKRFPGALLRHSSIRAFNELNWRKAPRSERGRPRALVPYFFPLDAVGQWNRLYGSAGLVQYQFVVPSGEEAALERCFELIQRLRLPVFLAVFKRFGDQFGGPMSFPLNGWTLAIDLPADAAGLGAALDQLDQLVAGCGGRVYLTKDARLRPELLRTMYPQLDLFNQQRSLVDPDGVLRSDLARRVGLLEHSA